MSQCLLGQHGPLTALLFTIYNINPLAPLKDIQPEATAYYAFGVSITRKNPMRKTLVNLGIGCCNLRVETGRCDKIPLDERICSFCSGNKIEDETHLLLDCQRYSSMWDIFLSKVKQKLMIFENYRMKIWYHNWWILMITILTFD